MALKKVSFFLGNCKAGASSLTWERGLLPFVTSHAVSRVVYHVFWKVENYRKHTLLENSGEPDLPHFVPGRNILKKTSYSCEF